ncbi:glycosyltransferase [Amniculibacterium aquaticum]|uniref:glycosyltransferase n=1 Tax=Amniculibacterium aquaticum TaxID=2479858 RepID=UPI000F58F50C|nr:glycosyltransferase [Amniculibacterium aquaticum]
MKIGFVLNSLQDGGIARVATTYANLIAENTNNDVYIIVLHKIIPLFEVSSKIKIIENDSIRSVGNKISYTINTFLFLRKVFKEYKFDRLVVNGEWITSFSYFASVNTGTKKVYFFDHSNPLRKKQSPYAFADKIAYKKADNILVLSEAAKEVINKKVPQAKKITIVENPVLFLDKNEKIESKNIIISMGRLSSEKGQDILIKAFAKSDNKDWELHFLGDGPLKAELIKLVEKLNITEKVVFLGNQKNIADFLSTAKIYVMPSKTENFPMALLEVMSLGLPCIVTDCMPWRGDEDFIINNANGIKVPVDGVDEMAMALSRLINNDEERSFFSKKSLEIRERLNLNKTLEAFSKAIKI